MDYKIDVVDYLKVHYPDGLFINRNTGEFHYSVNMGYIKVHHKESDETGSSEFTDVHHPNVFCEGSGVCIWCGRLL